MADRQTLEVYARRTGDYAARAFAPGEHKALDAFLDRLAPGARVLDLGCGTGEASARMADRGYRPDPVDASPEMVRHALDAWGLPARVMTFDALDADAAYDAVWASFSLLHATRGDFPGHLRAIRRALVPAGLFYLGMKLGTGAARDRLGRFYTYYTQDELAELVRAAGFRVLHDRTGKGTGLDGSGFAWCQLTAQAA